ncbi:hypothetical protein [Pandoraea apista]|uniref:hypothetical protein n=1 Tax=Pandoraea apista TaxID=93218 RepID=UPI001C129DBA|nr:hypothetical protein [Pandoraea apista]
MELAEAEDREKDSNQSIEHPDAQAYLLEAVRPLVGQEIHNLRIPVDAAATIEPSQIGTIVGTLTDALLPSIAERVNVGLKKGPGVLGDREGYPDFEHASGYRLELKGLFKDNPDVQLKKPPTQREPSARLTQKVTVQNVDRERDALLLLVYQLQPTTDDPSLLSPVVVDLGVFPVSECVAARDHRLTSRGGRWFGDYETPVVLSKAGKRKLAADQPLDIRSYGRKEGEGKDYNEDTNFGKLKRIPYKPLQEFLKKHGAAYAASGTYPTPWKLINAAPDLLTALEEEDDQAE